MKKGIVLVEVLLAAGLLAVILVPMLNFLITGVENSWFATREIGAQALAREALEALRSVRERDWDELVDGSYYPQVSTGAWQLVADESGETIGPFHRLISLEPVYRNDLGEIIDSGGQLDPSTRKAVISVSWRSLRDRVFSLTTYLTRYLENLVWTQTTQAEFDQGEKEYVKTTNDNGGEVILEGGCAQNPEGPLIYDEQFHNTWRVHPSAQNDIREITAAQGEVYEGDKALELTNFNGADTKLRNVESICTLGFTRFEFYVYSTADVDQSFGIHGEWGGSFTEVVVPPRQWHHVSLVYADVSGGDEINLDFLFFKPFNLDSGTIFYFDNLTLAGGSGGYYSQGIFTSSVFDALRETTFNRISYNADVPAQASIGFQLAASDAASGPWVFYGPGGTSSEADLYTDPGGEGIWLGNNWGRYCRYRAYLFSEDGTNTPTLYDVSINYAP